MRQFTKYPQRIVAAVQSLDTLSLDEACLIARDSSDQRMLNKIWKLYPNDRSVAETLSYNPYTPSKILEEIYQEYPFDANNTFKNHVVLSAIAMNPNTPQHILMELLETAQGDHAGLQPSAACNPNFPADVLLSRIDSFSPSSREAIAMINHDPDVLSHLADDSDFRVRREVAMNRSTPDNVLNQLANDENEFVRASVNRARNIQSYFD